MSRLFSQLHITVKADSNGKRTFKGIATTLSTDRDGDIVEPKGAVFKLPLPLLWQHSSWAPIGWVRSARVTDKGIEVEGEVANIEEEGTLKARLDEAWQTMKSGLVRGLSIGFRILESARIENSYGLHITKWSWLELSAVTIAANQDASITAIKSADDALWAASGREQSDGDRRDNPPGVTGTTKQAASGGSSFSLTLKGSDIMTLKEQIAALQAARQAKAARMQAIMQKAADESRSTDATEAEEFDTLKQDIAKADADLDRLTTLEAVNKAAAVPVHADPTNADGGKSAAQNRGGNDGASQPYVTVRPNVVKGTAFVRYVMALARSKGSLVEAQAFSRSMIESKRWHDTPQVADVLSHGVQDAIKAASDAGTTTASGWASQLVYYNDMASEFVELLRPATIIGKFGVGNVPSLRRVPFNIRMASQTGGGTYNWVGEGKPKPVGELTLDEITLRWAKASGIIVVTDELMRHSSPSVEGIVRDDMIRGMAHFSDLQFVDPQVFEVSNVSPASITNGVTDVQATGTDADALRTDLGTLFGRYSTANISLSGLVFIMSERTATKISLMRNALGQKEYPDMTPNGGILEGFPVIASESVPDSSDGGLIIAVKASDVFFSDDGPVTIDASREASLDMNTTPADPTVAATVMVNLWQRNMIGLKAERYMNWKKRRNAAVQYITGANYSQGS